MAEQICILGMDAKLYYGPPGSAATNEFGVVGDVTLSVDVDEVEVKKRANSGWRARVTTLRDLSVEFELVRDPADTAFVTFRNALLNGTLVALKVLDRANGEGPDGDFCITAFKRSEPVDGPINVSVTAKLALYRTWVEGS